MMIVEVGLLLDKDLSYYDLILKNNGLINDFNCFTHDIYFTNSVLDNLSENEMKNKCIRLRSVNDKDYSVQNSLGVIDDKVVLKDEFLEFENKMKLLGYRKVFDTIKKDHHYFREGMSSKVQLQEINDIGLVVYFDNKLYYEYDLKIQRNKLIDELNSYGFNFKYSDLGIDKLRTLYYGEKLFSLNQNG